MSKNKEPDLFIKEFKGIFKKIVTMPIENELNSVSADELYKISIQIYLPLIICFELRCFLS